MLLEIYQNCIQRREHVAENKVEGQPTTSQRAIPEARNTIPYK